jgi:hypothetical protein
MGASSVATVQRVTTPPGTLLQELAGLEPAALADRLALLADEQARLNAAILYGTRRLAEHARRAEHVFADASDERVTIDDLVRLTGRSRSWIEHHRDAIPGRCQTRRGGKVRWRKGVVLRWLAAGGC